METIIISLLLLAIGLLLYVALINGKKEINSTPSPNKSVAELPDIMGRPNPSGRQLLPSATKPDNNQKSAAISSRFDLITEVKPSEVPQEEPEDPDNALPNWKEEEEELERYASFSTSEGLATGVTFDELATVGRLLERKALEPSEKDTAVSMIAKIDGTELLGLLESRVGDASRKIARLLDRELT